MHLLGGQWLLQADSDGGRNCTRQAVWPLLPGFRRQASEVALLPTKLHPKAHRDFLGHQKVLLSLPVAKAAVRWEETSPRPGHEQETYRGLQELQVPSSGGSACGGQQMLPPTVPLGTHAASSLQ